MPAIRVSILAACLSTGACAHAIQSVAAPPVPRPDALVVLPGFGYSPGGEAAFRKLAPSLFADGIDLYVPTYIGRDGLDDSRVRLQQALGGLHLQHYARVHVFAFIAGGWTVNPLLDAGAIPNLATIVYDRSPYQERAPRIARDRVPVLTWLRYGSTVFDVARTPYAPLTANGVRIGLLVETLPTPFIRRFAKAAARQGDYEFGCDGFDQRYDDCFFAPLNHAELYARFADVWPEIRSFIRDGRFTDAANRTPPSPAASLAEHR